MLVKVDEQFNEDLIKIAQCLGYIRHYVLRNEGRRFKKGDWLDTLQWISAAAEALGRVMNALGPEYFQKRIGNYSGNPTIEPQLTGK